MEARSTPLMDTMYVAKGKEMFDAASKRILSEKHMLAWILHTCVEEFCNVPVQKIAEECIEGTPEISSIGVLPEQTNHIQGMSTEDTSVTEGKVLYDIRFHAIVPKTGEDGSTKQGERVRLIINLEAQGDYHTPYPLLTRAIYYLSRMISAQYGTEFSDSHYGDIKKVYSIWICMNAPKEQSNTITRYRIDEFPVVGNTRVQKTQYDLLCAVMVYLGDRTNTDVDMLRLLDTVFHDDMSFVEKKRILQQDYAIPVVSTFSKEVEQMSSFGQGFIDRVTAEVTDKVTAEVTEKVTAEVTDKVTAEVTDKVTAEVTDKVTAEVTEKVTAEANERVRIAEDKAEKAKKQAQVAEAQAQQTERLNLLRNLLSNSTMDFEQAVRLLGLPAEEWEQYRAQLGIDP